MEKVKYVASDRILNFLEKSRSGKVARVEKIVNNWMRNFGGLSLEDGKVPEMNSFHVPMEIYRSSHDNYSEIPMQVFRNDISYEIPFEVEDRRNFRD